MQREPTLTMASRNERGKSDLSEKKEAVDSRTPADNLIPDPPTAELTSEMPDVASLNLTHETMQMQQQQGEKLAEDALSRFVARANRYILCSHHSFEDFYWNITENTRILPLAEEHHQHQLHRQHQH